jgi:hypothetical protein
MSKAEFLIIAGTVIGAFVTILSAIDKNIISIFLEKEATSADKAIAVQKNMLLARWRLKRLKQKAVIIENDSAKWYYNAAQYKMLLNKRVRIVISIMVIVLLLTVVFFN